MALKGEQFHNTYMPGRPDWLSPEHHTRQGPAHLRRLHTTRGMIHDGQPIGGTHGLKIGESPPPVTDDEITTFDVNPDNAKWSGDYFAPAELRGDVFGGLQVNNAPVPLPQEELSIHLPVPSRPPGTNRQGMLFDPYTGTGLPRDPTVSKEQRLAAVDHQLDLRGKGAPQLRETYAAGGEPISEFYRPIQRSQHGDKAGAGPPAAGSVAERPKVVRGRGQYGGGVYQTRTNTASVNSSSSTIDYPTRSLTRPTKDATSTGTVWNPDWYTGRKGKKGKEIMPKDSKIEDHAMQPIITANILKHSFHNPETGETLDPHTGPNEPVFMPWTEETPEEIADPRRYTNQIRVDRIGPTSEGSPALLHGGQRRVTGTSGEADPFKHLGRFHPASFESRDGKPFRRLVAGYIDSWDTANALRNLHEAGFQSELHRGSGKTKDRSLIPPDPVKVHKKDHHSTFTVLEHSLNLTDKPTQEYNEPHDPDRDPRLGPRETMLPTKEAEGFLTKRVSGGERIPMGEWRSGINYDVDFHKRSIPSETETVERQYRKDTMWPDADTAFHERGHAIDPNIGLRTVNRGSTSTAQNDPVNEGIADAASDRTIRYSNVHEDSLNPSLNPNRVADLLAQSRGYGIKNKAWKNDEDRAIYAATRIHSAMADEPNIPNRVDLVIEQHGPRGFGELEENSTLKDTNIHSQRNTDIANKTLLGKLYHENEHVRDGLRDLGFGRIGMQAAESHVRRMEDKASAAEDAAPDETQLSFWPREGVNE